MPQVLRILNHVDSNILQTLYTQLLQGGPVPTSCDFEETTRRLLEINEIISEGHGELYAQHLKNILHALEGEGSLDRRQVLEEAVETVLVYIRIGMNSHGRKTIAALELTDCWQLISPFGVGL